MRGVTEKACKAGVLLASALLLTGMQTRLGDLDTRLLETHNRERARQVCRAFDRRTAFAA